MIAAAVNVFVIEPMRYCVSCVVSRSSSTFASPTTSLHTTFPSRATAALTLGTRRSLCVSRTRRLRSAASVSRAAATRRVL